MIDALSVVLALAGAAFFFAGTVGLLRFPDVYCRLHALTKADNLGLGFMVASLAIRAESVAVGMKLLLIWGVTLAGASMAAYLVANGAVSRGVGGVRGAARGERSMGGPEEQEGGDGDGSRRVD